MKKLFQLLSLLCSSMLLSQTILNTYPIDLRNNLKDTKFISSSVFSNSTEDNQIISVENEKTHEVFVFIKDIEKITILQYNSALFLKRECVFLLQNLKGKSIIGCSFNKVGDPTLYMTLAIPSNVLYDFVNKIPFVFSFKFDLESKTHTVSSFKFPANEFAVTTFQTNNSFYILAQHRIMHGLIVYAFQDAKIAKKGFDFSSFSFQDRKGKIYNFNDLIKAYPIEKIDVFDYNPLDKVVKESKLYIHKNHIILTLDHNHKKTQAFDINLENNELIEKNFPKSVLQDLKKMSNSFYQDGQLYQINTSKSELLLDIKDFNSDLTLKTIRVLNEGDKRSKNAPLFIQTDLRNPHEIRSPKRFLQYLQTLDIGLSVFKNKENTFITFGGVPKPKKQGDSFQHQNYIVNGFDEEDEVFNQNFSTIEHFKTVYFSRTLDRNFDFLNQEQQPLGINKLYYFLSTNKNITLENILKFKDYYILGYYDTKLKQYVMRKFTDGFY